MKTLLTILVIFFLQQTSFADEQRLTTIFKSKNGKYLLKYKKKRWTLFNQYNKPLYHINDNNYTSMTIFISNDGHRIVVINDFVEGHLIKEKPGLIFFLNGKQTANYKLTNIIDDTCNVTKSIWHTTWSLEDFNFAKTDSIFSLATFDFNEFEFDTYNGKLIKKIKPVNFDQNTLIVYGKFHKGENEEVTMKILKHIAGKKLLAEKLLFKTKSYEKGNWKEALMIKNGIDVTPLRFRRRFIGYSCIKD